MQIKTTMRKHFTSTIMTKITTTTTPKFKRPYQELMRIWSNWNSGGNASWSNQPAQLATSCGEHTSTKWPVLTLFLGYCRREMQIVTVNVHSFIHDGEMSETLQTSTHRQMDKAWHIRTLECHLPIKMSKAVIHSTMGMNLKTIRLRKWTRCKGLRSHVHKMPENIYSDILTKRRSPIAWDLEWKKGWSRNRLAETLGYLKCFMSCF